MKLVTYLKQEQDQLALCVNGLLYDTDTLHPDLPLSMAMFLNYWEDVFPLAQLAEEKIKAGMVRTVLAVPFETVQLLAPVPHPSGFRNALAFRPPSLNVAAMAAFEQYPVFNMANHNSIQGPGDITCMPDHFQQLDFELSAGIVVCKAARNITADEADEYIGGLLIMNSLGARQLETEEILLPLGPAKGKDFATAIGPMLVTLDELEAFETPCKEGHSGKNWKLSMNCKVNGETVSQANLGDMEWTFAEIIERASYGMQLFPGDIIGSGVAGGGCFLQLNKTGKQADPAYADQWLQEGDLVEMEIEGLGLLSNTIVKDESDLSLLGRKK